MGIWFGEGIRFGEGIWFGRGWSTEVIIILYSCVGTLIILLNNVELVSYFKVTG